MRSIRILTFGNLLKEFGGRLTTGLSIVIWRLAYHLNTKDNLDVWLAATDSVSAVRTIDSLKVLGWTFKSLLIFCIVHPALFIYYLYHSFLIYYNFKFKFLKSLGYLIFYHQSILIAKPDILHIHGINYIYIHYLHPNIKKGKETIITIHGILGHDANVPNSKYYRQIEILITRECLMHIVFITTDLERQWIRLYGDLITPHSIILNAYDDKVFFLNPNNKKDKSQVILTTVGRISPLKGQIRVIEALSKMGDSSKIIYWVIGTGEKKYVQSIKQKALESMCDVKFWGELNPEETAQKLRESDFMILPSSSEGFGLVFIESIACGTKVILPRNLPIAKEASILSNQNAFFLDSCSSDNIASILNKIDRYTDYSRERVSLTIKKMSWDDIANEYLKILK